MTKARDLANIISGGFTTSDLPTLTASEIPNLDTAKITSGTFADARIAASNVSQHATSFDDNKIVNDISTLAIRQASNENKSAYNTQSMFVDVFQDSTGIASLTSAIRNDSEYVDASTVSTSIGGSDSGNVNGAIASISDIKRTSDNVVVSAWTNSGGSTNLHDSAFGNTSADSTWPATDTSGTSVYFTLTPPADYKVGGTKVYSNLSFSIASRNNTTALQWSGSLTENGTYTNLGSAGSIGTGGEYVTAFVPSTVYNFYRCTFPNGVNTSGYWREVYIKHRTVSSSTSINATGNFISNAITASSSTNKMGAVITYQDNAGTNALNTDIVLQLSADGGSNFSTATMTAMPDFASGIKMAKVNDLNVTAGSSLKYKISFANQSNSKNARIRGVSLQY